MLGSLCEICVKGCALKHGFLSLHKPCLISSIIMFSNIHPEYLDIYSLTKNNNVPISSCLNLMKLYLFEHNDNDNIRAKG